MGKTEKVVDVWDMGMHIVCIKHNQEEHPYRVYICWYDAGYHRKLIGKGDSLVSVLGFIRDTFNKYQAMKSNEGVKA